jgi:capsular exopolysaccharide synthesis family protein
MTTNGSHGTPGPESGHTGSDGRRLDASARPGTPVSEPTYLWDLWQFTRRNRFLVLAVPLITAVATAALVQSMTPVYEAEALIRVDEERTAVPLVEALRSLTMVGGGSQIHTEMAVLRARVVAEDVVDSLNLNVRLGSPRRVVRSELFDHLASTRTAAPGRYRLERRGDAFRVRADGDAGRVLRPGERTVAPGERFQLAGLEVVLSPAALDHDVIELVVDPFHDALRNFRRTARVSQPTREADIMAINYKGPDPELVRDVPAVMARVFIDRRQAGKSAEARATVEFLDDQIATVAAELQRIENDLLRFQETHGLVHLETEAKTEIERLALLQAERDVAEAERSALTRTLERIAGDGGPVARRLMYFPTLLRSAAAAETMGALTALENRRSTLLELRTPEDPEVVVLTDRIDEMERELTANAMTYLDGLGHQVVSYDRALAGFRSQLERVPARQIQLMRMEREAGILEETYLLMEARRKQGEIDAAITDYTVQVVDPPAFPVRPVRPRKLLSVLLAGMLGMVLGIGAAFTREQLDTRVRTREDLRTASGELPVLGAIPRMQTPAEPGESLGKRSIARILDRGNGRRLGVEDRLVTRVDPRSPVSEAYRALRTNITFSRMERPPRTLVFTSAMPGDGKSTSASNLAITLAQQGINGVLIDADLRRGALHQAFAMDREPGLSELLLGRAALDDVVRSVELGGDRVLNFIASGGFPANPAELLGSPRMRELLAGLMAPYDTVILDAPPLNLVTDAAILGTLADGVIVVARAAATDRGALAHAISQLDAVNAPILGTILNNVDARKERYYGSYAVAGSYYAED